MKASFLGFGTAGERECLRSNLLQAFVVAVVMGSTGAVASPAHAGEPLADKHDFLNDVASLNLERTAELEALFWMCDYASSAGDLDVGQAEQCNAVKEQLKRDKFVGDSEKLLAWWRLNKDVAYRQLAGARSDASECMNVAQSESRSQR